jgi:MATE family multidrug resistance protein
MLVKLSVKDILKVSGPVMFGAFINFLITVTDLALSARIDTNALNAVGNGGLLIIALSMLGVGLGSGTQILIARKTGANQLKEVGVTFSHALLMITILGSILLLFVKLLVPTLLAQIVAQQSLLTEITNYTNIRSFSMISFFLCQIMIAFYTGIAKTKDLIGFTILVASVNILLDFILIFGMFQVEPMGVSGAATASVIAELCGFSYLFIASLLRKYHVKFGLFSFKHFKKLEFKEIANLSAPLMIQELLSVGSWSAFFFIIERKGENDLAASQVLRNLYYFSMIPAWGLAATIRTYVSNLLGAKQEKLVPETIKKVALLSLALTSFIVIIVGLKIEVFTEMLAGNSELVQPVKNIFYVVFGVMLVYSLSLVLFHSITGAGYTKSAMKIEIIAIGSYLILAWLFAVKLDLPIHLIWSAEFAYFGLMLLLSYNFLKRKKLLV